MKYDNRPQHPDIVYWTCPDGDAHVTVSGSQFGLLAAMGMTVESADLAEYALPQVLEMAEAKVEEHEASHGVAS